MRTVRVTPEPRSLRSVVFVLLAVVLAGGCTKGTEPDQSSFGRPLGLVTGAGRRVSSIDDDFEKIAELVPGFGGMFIDSAGRLVAWTTNIADSGAIAGAIRSVDGGSLFRSSVERGGPPWLDVRLGAYDFRQLRQWRDWFRAGAWTPGMTLLDIDEVTNRLRIGVEDAAALDVLRNRLAELRIPQEAVITEFDAAPVPDASLTDGFRPIPGAVQVESFNGLPELVYCTVTANAVTDIGPGFITNSHCTYRFGNNQDGTEFHQPIVTNLVGREAADGDIVPPGQNCPGQDGCRFSDAAFILYAASGLNEQGKIARTSGGTTIDDAHPRFLLNDPLLSSLMVGDLVNKIGRRTGWTQGHVTSTCFDAPWDLNSQGVLRHYYLQCQYTADYVSDAGDSGSPVFTRDGSGDHIDLRGIHEGHYVNDFAKKVFAPWRYVTVELEPYTGPLNVKF